MKPSLLFLLLPFLIISWKSGAQQLPPDLIRIDKSISPFQVLKVYDDIHVILLEGKPALTIEGSQKAVSNVEIVQENNQMEIRKKSHSRRPLFVYITVNDLRILEVLQDATVSSSDKLHGDLLVVKLAGNGEVNIMADNKKVITTSSANGKIMVQGNYNASSTFRSGSGQLFTCYYHLSTDESSLLNRQ